MPGFDPGYASLGQNLIKGWHRGGVQAAVFTAAAVGGYPPRVTDK